MDELIDKLVRFLDARNKLKEAEKTTEVGYYLYCERQLRDQTREELSTALNEYIDERIKKFLSKE